LMFQIKENCSGWDIRYANCSPPIIGYLKFQ
jgi:hypothetical protein